LGVERLERRMLLSDLGLGLVTSLATPSAITSLSSTQSGESGVVGMVASETWRISASPGARGNAYNPGAGVPQAPPIDAIANAVDNADIIPDIPHAVVVGKLGSNESIDLYKIPIDPNTTALQINVKAMAPSSDLPGRLWLIDGSGHLVGNWYLPANTHEFTLNLQALHEPFGTTIVFGVSHGNRPATDGSAANYALSVSRETSSTDQPPAPASVIAPMLPANGPAVSMGPVGRLAAQPADTSQTSDVGLAAQPAGAAIPSGVGGSLVVTGSLPTRSAGSIGGWFADSESTPPIDPLEAALVDLRLIDILPQRVSAREQPGLVDDYLAEPHGDAKLVAFESPGGFPLLAAALSPSRPHAQSEVSAALLPAICEAGGAVALSESASPAGSCHPDGASDLIASDPAGERTETRPKRRGSLMVGFNVVATLTFGFLLPDLVAALQGAEPRRPLPRAWRPKRGERASGR
jgi:hypothetical protein